MMLKLVATGALAGVIAAGIILAGSALPSVGASTALAPATQQILRTALFEETVDLPGGVYNIVLAELLVDPGAETPVHVHPGPTAGFVADGRVTISLAEQGATGSYSAGSSIRHPWDIPHVMSNRSEARARMYSFEINPVN